ncbi:hypothetical protein GIB67_000061 [Kingdonia uniflora]|uniref:Aminotransferase-like plant mobile domain-containing protein n=1 Tax=Kingdonia uniflora TaxID=39325 RepID=A0A7J7MEP2_9MAGN|nr:hypothetical protein GIB67_000061 [Kingdonia uniflora]
MLAKESYFCDSPSDIIGQLFMQIDGKDDEKIDESDVGNRGARFDVLKSGNQVRDIDSKYLALTSKLDNAKNKFGEITDSKSRTLLDNSKGWKNPQKKWKQWVDQMCEIYGEMWKVTGLYEAIIGSTYEIKKDREMVLGLVEWWCPETNTFVFPWGEVTTTLEDVMLIGGLSVLGKPVTTCLSGDLVNIKDEMIKQFRICYKSKWKKVHHSAWMNQFMGNNLELEYVAFLAFWLSRFVFHVYPKDIICKKVFPVAIRLAQGIQIAFAPAVFASIYRDLRVLINHVFNNSGTLCVWAPFQIMQIWAYKRLPTLRSESKSLRPGEPRMARWHKLNSSSDLKILRFHMSSPKNF